MDHRTFTRTGFYRRILAVCLLGLVSTAGSCNSETLFRSNFETTDFNQPPAPTQAVGTAEVSGATGSVLVAAAPPDASPPAKWLRIFRPNDPSQISVFRGKLVHVPGNGTYVISSTLVIPDGNNGPVSLQLENSAGEGFLHLDFMPEGNVRIDDDASTVFGSYTKGQAFIVQVTLTVNDTSPTAHILLSGVGGSGEANRTIAAPFRPRAQQFGAVRLFVGFNHLATFHAANVAVTRKS
jgi:hypothetical protein